MGRPRISDEPRVVTAVRLPSSVHRRLRAAAEDRAVSANLLVTRAVAEYLDRLPSCEVELATDTPHSGPAASESASSPPEITGGQR